jgi:hypothetical protein
MPSLFSLSQLSKILPDYPSLISLSIFIRTRVLIALSTASCLTKNDQQYFYFVTKLRNSIYLSVGLTKKEFRITSGKLQTHCPLTPDDTTLGTNATHWLPLVVRLHFQRFCYVRI